MAERWILMTDEPTFYQKLKDQPIGANAGLMFVSKRTWEYISFSVYRKMENGSWKLMLRWPIPGKDIKEVNLSLKEFYS